MPSLVPHLGACVVAIGTTLTAVASEVEPVGAASRAAAVCTASSTETLPVSRARLLQLGHYRGPRASAGDPPIWPLPARHTLGAALLRADRAREARTDFLADLQRYPQNCIALAGIAAAERQQYSSLGASLDSSARLSAPSHCPE